MIEWLSKFAYVIEIYTHTLTHSHTHTHTHTNMRTHTKHTHTTHTQSLPLLILKAIVRAYNYMANANATELKLVTISGVFTTHHGDIEVIEVVPAMVAKAPLVVAKNFKSLSNHYNHFFTVSNWH